MRRLAMRRLGMLASCEIDGIRTKTSRDLGMFLFEEQEHPGQEKPS
jgi:hypothetical protein